MQSPQQNLNSDDAKAMAMNAAKIAVGAAVEAVLHYLSGQSWGQYQGIVTIAVAGLLDLLHKYLDGPGQ